MILMLGVDDILQVQIYLTFVAHHALYYEILEQLLL